MAAPASPAVKSSAGHYPVAAIISAPVLSTVTLLTLLGGGIVADAAAAPAAPGVVPAEYEALVQKAAQNLPRHDRAPLPDAQLEQVRAEPQRRQPPPVHKGCHSSCPAPGSTRHRGVTATASVTPLNPADAIAGQGSFICTLLAAVTPTRA